MGYPAFYLLDIRHTNTSGAADWYQYLRMGAQKNQLRLYL